MARISIWLLAYGTLLFALIMTPDSIKVDVKDFLRGVREMLPIFHYSGTIAALKNANIFMGLDVEAVLFTMGIVFSILSFYWFHHYLIYLFCYKLDWFSSYKIQGRKFPDREIVAECTIDMMKRHALMPFLSYVLFKALFKGRLDFDSPLPSFADIFVDQLVYQALFDTYFYWAHRLLHHPSLYGLIHMQHHRFTTPIGICAAWASVPEDILVNLVSTLIGPLLYPRHFLSFLIHLCLRLHETVDSHSGYDFPWSLWHNISFLHGGSRRHDWHHSHNDGNYGGYAFWDWLCGTDKEYKKYEMVRQYARAVPEEKKQKLFKKLLAMEKTKTATTSTAKT